MSSDVQQWKPKVDLVIAKYCKGLQVADREDAEQEAWLALVEAERIDNGGHAYVIARNRVINYVKELQRNGVLHISLEDCDELEDYDD